MVQSVNKRQSLEVFLTVLMSIAIILNLNSITAGVGQASEQLDLGGRAEQVVGTLASASGNAQQISEKGVVQSLFATATGGQFDTPAEQSGNIGTIVAQSGTWLIGLFTPTERTAPTHFATAIGSAFSDVPEPILEVAAHFEHLRRPMVSDITISEELLNEIKEIRTNLATMIMVF